MSPIKADGYHHASGDDGAIHVGKAGEKDCIASTTFRSERVSGKSWELRVQGTRPDVRVMGANDWLQFSLAEYGAKRSKHSSACLMVAQVRRLRDLCNMVLGEAS